MKHVFLPLTILVVSVTMLLLLGYAATQGFLVGTSPSNTSPTVLFQRGIVTGLDAAGMSQGIVEIFKVDGFLGSPKRIYRGATVSRLPDPSIKLTGGNLEIVRYINQADLDSDLAEKTVLSLSGDVLVHATNASVPLPNVLSSSVTSPDGLFEVSGEQKCLEKVVDEPCRSTFKLTIMNKSTGQEKELGAAAFGFFDPGNYFVKVVGFTANDRQAVVSIYWGGEPGPGGVWGVRVDDGSVEQIYANKVSSSLTQRNYYEANRLSPDGVKLYVVKQDLNYGKTTLLERNLDNGGERTVFESTEYGEFDFSPDGSHVLVGSYGKPTLEIDLVSDQAKNVPGTASYSFRSKDGSYVAAIEYESSNGAGPQKLVLTDLATGRSRTIYEQKVIAHGGLVNAPPGGRLAGAGNYIYAFIGIL